MYVKVVLLSCEMLAEVLAMFLSSSLVRDVKKEKQIVVGDCFGASAPGGAREKYLASERTSDQQEASKPSGCQSTPSRRAVEMRAIVFLTPSYYHDLVHFLSLLDRPPSASHLLLTHLLVAGRP